jgi:hypothetical protein
MMPQVSSVPVYAPLPVPAGTPSGLPGNAIVHADAAVVTGVVVPALPVVEAAVRHESVYDLMLAGMTNEFHRSNEPRANFRAGVLQVFLEWLGS